MRRALSDEQLSVLRRSWAQLCTLSPPATLREVDSQKNACAQLIREFVCRNPRASLHPHDEAFSGEEMDIFIGASERFHQLSALGHRDS